jgi:hypothetical protein
MQFAASAIWCPTRNCYCLHVPCNLLCDLQCDLVRATAPCGNGHGIAHQIASAIWCKKKLESDSCRTANRRYTKSHLRYAANRTWNRTRNRWCNQPLWLRSKLKTIVCPKSNFLHSWYKPRNKYTRLLSHWNYTYSHQPSYQLCHALSSSLFPFLSYKITASWQHGGRSYTVSQT